MPLTLSPLRAPPGSPSAPPRLRTGIYQFDRAFGGGVPLGSTSLIAGDPGAGKSTLLLQAAASLASRLAPRHRSRAEALRAGHVPPGFPTDPGHADPDPRPVVYLSGEEPVASIQARAARLGLSDAPLLLAHTSDVFEAVDALTSPPLAAPPALVVWDSLQRLTDPALRAAPGSPSQTRAVLRTIIDFARHTGAACLVVSHVNAAGRFTGARALQHDVDTTLFFEAAPAGDFRVLYAVKNRYGAAASTASNPDARGLFQMSPLGLVPLTPTNQLAAERAYLEVAR